MSLSKLLYGLSYVALIPGVAALAVTLIGAKTNSTGELVIWCTRWWWAALIYGAVVFYLVRSIAWMLRRFRGL